MSELANQLIEENKKTQDPYLDLGNCGLTELPKALGDCMWLEALILSEEWDEFDLSNGDWQQYKSRNKDEQNNISSLQSVEKLVRLKKIVARGNFEWELSDLSPLKNLSALKKLDCSNTRVSNLSPLKDLTNLQKINCSNTRVSNLSPLKDLNTLQKIDCSNTQVSDLSPIQGLSVLQRLSCSNTKVSDLSPLKALNALQELDCSITQVSDLSPLKDLAALQILFCAFTQVGDLSPLKGLTDLQILFCFSTHVWDLLPLKGLTDLQILNCSNLQVSDLSPLKDLTNLQKLSCSYTQVSHLSPIQGLSNLQKLSCSYTQVSDLSPLQGFSNLQHLECQSTQVSDLSPLQGLSNLQHLECSFTQVSDLSPLQGLSNLQHLECSFTQVSDLSPLQGLSNLQHLECQSTQVSDLSPLQGLSNLQHLECSSTQVSDLSPLQGLSNLQHLECDSTQVSDLSPIQGLSNLQHLECQSTQVSDLSPLQGLSNLQHLECDSTQVSDLSPLQGLSNLQHLECDSTQVSDLSPLQGLSALQQLFCSSTQVSDLSPLQGLSNLQQLKCDNCPIETIPADIAFSGDASKIRQYLLSNPDTPFHEVKLILSGNTKAGKTNLADFLLQGDAFEFKEDHLTSHGILVGRWEITPAHRLLPRNTKLDALAVNIWDFGGQDFYHGTHGIFFRNGAVYLLLWENSKEVPTQEQDVCFPVEYWLEDIRHHAFNSPLICLQNKTDRDQIRRFPNEWLELYGISPADEYHLSIKKATLEPLSEMQEKWAFFVKSLVRRLSEIPEREKAKINHNWLKIRDYIQALQNKEDLTSDNPFSGLSKENPYLTKADFINRCKPIIPNFEAVADTFILLFDKRGVLIHFPEHEKLKNLVFLNPKWVTGKIYELLDKSLLNNGQFDKAYALERLGENTEVLLQLMLEFEVIFADPRAPDTYIVVQYLPAFDAQKDSSDYHYKKLKTPCFQFRMPLFHQQRILRQLIVRMGSDEVYVQRLLRHDCILIGASDDTLIRIDGTREENTGVISIFAQLPEKWGIQMALEVLMVYFNQYWEFGIPALAKYGPRNQDRFNPEHEKRMRSFFDSDMDFEIFARILDECTDGIAHESAHYWEFAVYPEKLPKKKQVAQIWARFFKEHLVRAKESWEKHIEPNKDPNQIKITRAARFEHLCSALHVSVDNQHWVDFGTLLKNEQSAHVSDLDKKVIDKRPFEGLMKGLGYEPKKDLLNVFISYSELDEHHKNNLIKHLSSLRGKIVTWHDQDILPGENKDERTRSAILNADVVLYLVTVNSISTDYIQNVELPLVEERCVAGDCLLVPVIVDYCVWSVLDFAKHHALPGNDMEITNAAWANENQAWVKVVQGVQRILASR